MVISALVHPADTHRTLFTLCMATFTLVHAPAALVCVEFSHYYTPAPLAEALSIALPLSVCHIETEELLKDTGSHISVKIVIS